MAIYHLEAKVVSRGTGRSAVAASAYLSCTNILNDYDGVRHDYTRKKGLIWREVFLPEYAPPEWKDRGVLWNAVEENEKTKDSRLAREFVPALPVELTPTQWQELLSDFIKESFVADGMCADVAIHDPYPPGHNPHAHILLTVRPLDERGEWQYKTEKEYLCVKDGEERGFTAAEFKAAQADGWEKQYPYKVGRKKVYMPPSEAEKQGLERASKHPKSTKFGRQNPISERWNSEEQLAVWRAAWADVSNLYLERAGRVERIDYRSNAARGIDEIPTIHEGVAAQALERKGIISDRCELNRQIKSDNALLRELKKDLPVYRVKRHKALTVLIAELTEDLEELRSEKALLLQKFEYAEDVGAEAFRKDIATMEAGLKKLEAQEQKYSAELDKALSEYAELKAQAADFDSVELYKARQVLRPAQEKTAEERQVRQMVMQRQAAQQKSPLRSVWKKNDFER